MKYVPGTWPPELRNRRYWSQIRCDCGERTKPARTNAVCKHRWVSIHVGKRKHTDPRGSGDLWEPKFLSDFFPAQTATEEMLEEELTVIKQERSWLGVNAVKDCLYNMWLLWYPRKVLVMVEKNFFHKRLYGVNADALQEHILLYLYQHWIQFMAPCPIGILVQPSL